LSIDNFDKVDIVLDKKDGETTLIIAEGRDWKEIEEANIKIITKIRTYKKYARSHEFKKKHPHKSSNIILECRYEPPLEIKKILKQENVRYNVRRV